ncbi:MAG: PEP-CTERM sorting domain-containing protein [Acidobacteriaceae bacterium]|nr:PEP-CTERM sorting domain-containing protein [Acidobacteriaceae bacterium]
MTRTILASCLLAALLNAPAVASVLTVNPLNFNNTTTAKGDTSTGRYIPLAPYSEPGGFGVAFLLPPLPLELTRGGASTFFNTVITNWSVANAGWNFAAAPTDLAANTLALRSDQVGGAFPCYQGGGDCVGIFGTKTTSGFAVSYTGAAIANGHWIQALSTNVPAGGQTSPYLDNNASTTSPYYDVPYAANTTAFLDAPNRSPTQSTYWIADLFYASGGAAAGTKANPTQVTIYNGLVWGWANIWVPTGNVGAFLNTVNSDLTTVASLDNAFDADFTSLLTQSDVTQLDSEFLAAVPEPSTSLLFFIGVGLFGLGGTSAFSRVRGKSLRG